MQLFSVQALNVESSFLADRTNGRAIATRDWNPGFEKPGYPGNPDILPNPKPGFGHLLNPRVSTFFGFAFLHLKRCILMEYYITLEQ